MISEHISHNITTVFNEFNSFPISKFPVLNNPYNTSRRTTIDDIIQCNLNSIMPNVDIGLFQNTLNYDEILQWIETSKKYMNTIHQEYIQKCILQEAKLHNIIAQKKQCELLDINRVCQLPDDIIRIIYSYVLPETKIVFLLEKYPNKYGLLKLLSVYSLKTFYKNVIYPNYFSYHSFRHKNVYYRKYLLPDFNNIRVNPRNKTEYIEEIDHLLQNFRNPLPYSNEIYHFFQLRAYRLLKSIIYVGKRMAKTKKSGK